MTLAAGKAAKPRKKPAPTQHAPPAGSASAAAPVASAGPPAALTATPPAASAVPPPKAATVPGAAPSPSAAPGASTPTTSAAPGAGAVTPAPAPTLVVKPLDETGRAPVKDSVARPRAVPLPWIIADLGYAYGDRWYRHTEPSTGELRTYTAVRLHGLMADLVVYPAVGVPVWRDVGITLTYARAFSVDSRLAGATTESSQASTGNGGTGADSRGPFPTTYQRWDVGARFRFPTAPRADDWRFGAGAGYRQWQFDFDVGDAPPDREVPRARYSLLRASFDVERWFGRFAVRGLLGYLQFLGSTTLGDRTSQPFAWGGEVNLGFAFAIMPMLRVRAAGTYNVFRFPLVPLEGRNDEPGVVWDHYFTLAAGAEFSY